MFQVPESKKSINQNRFEFQLGDESYSMPLLKFAPVEVAELLEQGKEVAALLALCENDAARAALRKLDGEQFGALSDAWAAASGVSAGESQASSSS